MSSATPARPGRGRVRPVNLPDQPLDHFSDSLGLNSWLIAQFGFEPLPADPSDNPIRQLAHSVERIEEGLGADGLHRYYHAFRAALPQQSAVKADARCATKRTSWRTRHA